MKIIHVGSKWLLEVELIFRFVFGVAIVDNEYWQRTHGNALILPYFGIISD